MLKPGLYEQLVNNDIKNELEDYPESCKKLAQVDEAEAAGIISKYVKISSNKIIVNLQAFNRQDKIIQYRILKEIIPDKKRAIQINNIISWLKDKESKNYNLSKIWIVKKDNKQLKFISIK